MGKKKQKKIQKALRKEKQKQALRHHEVEPQQNQEQQSQANFDFTANQVVEGGEIQQIQFVFLSPNQSHYHSLKSLLANYSNCTNNKSHELADIVTQQKQFGIVILPQQQPQDDQFETAFSILTFLYFDKSSIMQSIKQYALKNCKSHADKKTYEKIRKIIEQSNISLLVNERFVNLPPSLVPLQHQTLAKEYQEYISQKSKPVKQIECEYLYVMTQVGRDHSLDNEKEKVTQNDLQNLIYKKFEDYEFTKQCEGYWIFPQTGKLIGKGHTLNLHYVIKTKEYLKKTKQLKELVDEVTK